MDIHYDQFNYHINVASTSPRFSSLSERQQQIVENHITTIVFESFIEPADDDYLAARGLAIGGLYRSFFWSAAQAVEKYLKAFLLFNDVSVRDDDHRLKTLINKAVNIDPEFATISVAPHPEVRVPADVTTSRFTLEEFVAELVRFGATANRYNDAGAVYDTGHLFSLDSLVHQLRSKMDLPEIRRSFSGRLSEEFRRYLYDNTPLLRRRTSSTLHCLVRDSPLSFPWLARDGHM